MSISGSAFHGAGRSRHNRSRAATPLRSKNSSQCSPMDSDSLAGRLSLQCLVHAFADVPVLVIPRRHAVKSFGEKRIPPFQYSAALGCEQGVPPILGLPVAVVRALR